MATMMEPKQSPGVSEYQQRQGMRPRSKSAFSITSDSSKRSGNKEKLRESHDEKAKLAFSNTTKANPNAAMNELQPSEFSWWKGDVGSWKVNVTAVAQQLEKATIASLRASTYFDMHGTAISMFDSLDNYCKGQR
jgi:hypothetical protein